jgi:chemotaxis protein methyltransferase CheR
MSQVSRDKRAGGDAGSIKHIGALLNERFGLVVAAHRHAEVSRKLENIAHANKLGGLDALYIHLTHAQPGDRLVARIREAISIGETSFYRTPCQLRFIEETIFPQLAQIPGPIKIWSAGCSSGEEVFTLAIMATDSAYLKGREIEVIGTDLVPERIAAAQSAVFSERALGAATPVWVKDRFFCDFGANQVRVRQDQLAAKVSFWVHDLRRDPLLSVLHGVSLVVCRNLFIYYDHDQDRRALVSALRSAMAVDGWLMLGHSDHLQGVPDGFAPVVGSTARVFRRALVSKTDEKLDNKADVKPAQAVAVEPLPLSDLRCEVGVPRQDSPVEDPFVLVAAGDLEAAERVAAQRLEKTPRDAALRILLGSLLERRQRQQAACALIEVGIFLDPANVILRYFAATLYTRAGFLVEAQAHQRCARVLEQGASRSAVEVK